MDNSLIILQAETFVHSGVGQSMGALDLPVARERTTHYPFIPGSGVKGAFRVWAKDMARMSDVKVKELFGSGAGDTGGDENAGMLLFSDARLLLLPVRCLSDAFKWVTCPALLRRFARDCRRAGLGDRPVLNNVSVSNGQYLGKDTQNNPLGLEEREFAHGGDIDDAVIDALKDMVDEAQLKQRLVILSDRDFTWFARYALPVMARNALDENKRVKQGALWYEESLAPDTIMYVLLGERKEKKLNQLTKHIGNNPTENKPYVQIGGNETIGQGWFKMDMLGADGGGE